MNQSYAGQACEKGVVQIFLDSVARLVRRLTQQQNLGSDRAGGGGKGSGAIASILTAASRTRRRLSSSERRDRSERLSLSHSAVSARRISPTRIVASARARATIA